jgi:hypothetical protein
MKPITPLLLALLVSCATSAPPAELLPPREHQGFVRVPIKPLAAKSVFASDGKLLVVDGVDATEMLLSEREYGDGVFRVEWRWRKHADPKGLYNGGVYVRTAADCKTWVQAQVARQEKAPVVGDLMADLPAGADGKPLRVERFQTGPSPEAPLGEWNVYEIECRGPRIALRVNGKLTAVWEDCPFPRGRVGVQGEFGIWEIRSMTWTPR